MTDVPKDYAPGDDPLNTGEGADQGTKLGKDAAAAAAQLRRTVEERATAARTWAVDQGGVLRDQVSERPLVAVGVSVGTAFAAGLVVGVLLASRR